MASKKRKSKKYRRTRVDVGDCAFITLPDGSMVEMDVEDADRIDWRRLYYVRSFGAVVYVDPVEQRQRRLGCYLLGVNSSVVHKDEDVLNHRKENLRPVVRQGSGMIRRKSVPNKYRGVYWDSRRGSYTVKVQHQGQVHYVGVFRSEVEAAYAYDRKAKEVMGENAVTNADLGLL